jgi:NAD+ synthase (glutamine-hydrolysing)
MKKLRVALCQINPAVGDIEGNTEKIIRAIRTEEVHMPDIIVFPELAVTGYPPEDLLNKPQFIDDNISALGQIAQIVGNPIVVVGFVDRDCRLFNAAAIIHRKSVVDIYHKIHLPNYGVFDEMRYFSPGNRCSIYTAGKIKFGVDICEDIWAEDSPARLQAASGAHLIININASPYHIYKHEDRLDMLSKRAKDNNIAIAYLNMTGGQDELVFDGHSLIFDSSGELIAEGKKFCEETILFDIVLDERQSGSLTCDTPDDLMVDKILVAADPDQAIKPSLPDRTLQSRIGIIPDINEDIYSALLLGAGDYIRKNNFSEICIGLSGGIDSSLVASIATDSLGSNNVIGIFMPSPYTSRESRIDAFELAGNMGIRILEMPISSIFDSFLKTLEPEFRKAPSGIAEENLQARIRGNILMGLSNKFGWLVLTTGNKSEMSVGYATLYGDMVGGFAPIKDIPKTLVYRLCEWRNRKNSSPWIPERVLTKEPTAELKPGQKDTDSLPPYDILDPILKAYIEDSKGFEEIVSLGYDAKRVQKVIKLVDRSEYKRRQSPPGTKITPLALGRDRRFPITNKYRSC